MLCVVCCFLFVYCVFFVVRGSLFVVGSMSCVVCRMLF